MKKEMYTHIPDSTPCNSVLFPVWKCWCGKENECLIWRVSILDKHQGSSFPIRFHWSHRGVILRWDHVAFTTFTALLQTEAYRQLLSVSSRPEDRAPIEGKMQMLQWWTEGLTSEALFWRGGGRLALCVCATHKHTTVITLTIHPGWWRRWGVGEKSLYHWWRWQGKAQAGDANDCYTQIIWAGVPCKHVAFRGLIMFLRLRACSGGELSCCNCSRNYCRNYRKMLFIWLSVRLSCFKGYITAVGSNCSKLI